MHRQRTMYRLLTGAITLAAVAAPLAVIAPIAPLAAQDTSANGDTFDWKGDIPAGNWLRVRNLNGAVHVSPASGNTVQVHGVKHWRRGNPEDVHFTVAKDGDGVTICALWHPDDTCDDDGYHSHGHHYDNDHDDVSVEFTVELPKGVKVLAATVNGGVDVDAADAEVVAESVNGSVDATSASGPVRATTVNGSVNARMAALPTGTGDLDYSTVNGRVTVEVPANLDADLDMETVNGSLESDFPLTVTGRVNPHHLRATIGSGGRRLSLRTVNGSIELRKLH